MSPSHPLFLPPSCPLIVLSLRSSLVVSSHRLVVALPLLTPPSCHPLTPPLSRHLVPAGCCVAFCRAALSSSCCAALLSSHCPLTALPSCCLIVPAGCCIASRCTALSLYSHCTTFSLSCSGWLLCCLLLHRPLILSLCRPFVLLVHVGWLLHSLHQTMMPPSNAPATTTTAAATTIPAVTTTSATATTTTTVVKLSIVRCLRKRQQQHHHQHTNGSTNVKTLTSPDDLDLFNLSTVFVLVEGIQQFASCWHKKIVLFMHSTYSKMSGLMFWGGGVGGLCVCVCVCVCVRV